MAYYSNPYFRRPQTISNKNNAPSRGADGKKMANQIALDEIVQGSGNSSTNIKTNTKPIPPVNKQRPEISAHALSLNKEDLIKGNIFQR